MLGLIVAGEAVFALPFHITRFFRATVLESFELTNTELGAAQGVYGIVAMLCYFPGGILADRFPPRVLLTLSLFATSAGGLYLASFPGYTGAVLVWGFFGITTILFFWAALIRATREWGAIDEQGRAFGLLDAGRGIYAASLASLAALVFGFLFPEGEAAASPSERKAVLQYVIYGYSAATALAGLFVWFALASSGKPDDFVSTRPEGGQEATTASLVVDVFRVLRMPSVWLIGLVVVCAYVSYKGFDNYSLYAVEGFGMSHSEAARLSAIGAWMRPVGALAAGFLGDRFNVTRMTVLCFALLLASQLFMALYTPQPNAGWVLLINLLIGGAAMFGLRALYYALMEESRVPLSLTGTAVGLISVVGFTPDVFVAYTGGMLLDRSPGITGHQHYFWFLAGFAAFGLLVSSLLMYTNRQAVRKTNDS